MTNDLTFQLGDIKSVSYLTPKLAAALVAAQAQLKNPKMDGVGHYKNRFATLLDVQEAVVPILNAHGVFVSQESKPVFGKEGELIGINLVTTFTHESGESLARDFFTCIDEFDVHSSCGASTYARRYGLLSASCTVGDPDDDGVTAMGGADKVNAKNQAKTAAKREAKAEPKKEEKKGYGEKKNLAADLWRTVNGAKTKSEVLAVTDTLDNTDLTESEKKIILKEAEKKNKQFEESEE